MGASLDLVDHRKTRATCYYHAGETISAEYQLEYGTDKIEVHKGAITPGLRVLLLDDLIATGGTLGAGIKLVNLVSRPTGLSPFHAIVMASFQCFRDEISTCS